MLLVHTLGKVIANTWCRIDLIQCDHAYMN